MRLSTHNSIGSVEVDYVMYGIFRRSVTLYKYLVRARTGNNQSHLDDYYLGLRPAATIDLLDHCLSNYFHFDRGFYQQIRDTPMGSPIFGLIAEAVLQRLERTVLTVIFPKFWNRYVDDTFAIVKQNNLFTFH